MWKGLRSAVHHDPMGTLACTYVLYSGSLQPMQLPVLKSHKAHSISVNNIDTLKLMEYLNIYITYKIK